MTPEQALELLALARAAFLALMVFGLVVSMTCGLVVTRSLR